MYFGCVTQASQDAMACTFRPLVTAELVQVSPFGCARFKHLSECFKFEENALSMWHVGPNKISDHYMQLCHNYSNVLPGPLPELHSLSNKRKAHCKDPISVSRTSGLTKFVQFKIIVCKCYSVCFSWEGTFKNEDRLMQCMQSAAAHARQHRLELGLKNSGNSDLTNKKAFQPCKHVGLERNLFRSTSCNQCKIGLQSVFSIKMAQKWWSKTVASKGLATQLSKIKLSQFPRMGSQTMDNNTVHLIIVFHEFTVQKSTLDLLHGSSYLTQMVPFSLCRNNFFHYPFWGCHTSTNESLFVVWLCFVWQCMLGPVN